MATFLFFWGDCRLTFSNILNLPYLMKDVFLSLLEFIEFCELKSPPPGNVVSFSSLAVFLAVVRIGATAVTFIVITPSLSSVVICDLFDV